MSLIAALVLSFLAVLARTPAVTLELGGLADWVSGLGSLLAVGAAVYGFGLVEQQRATDKKDSEDRRRDDLKELEDRRRNDQKDVEKGRAYELMAAIMDMANNIRALDKHFVEQRNDFTLVNANGTLQTYKAFNALIGLSDEGNLKLPSGTTELLVKADGIPVWNDLQLLANRNRSLTSLVKEYRILWDSIISKLPASKDHSGKLGKLPDNELEKNRIRAELVRLDSVVTATLSQMASTMLLLQRVASTFPPLMAAYFDGPFLRFEADSDDFDTEAKNNPQPPEGDQG